jgi:beta-lactamase class A
VYTKAIVDYEEVFLFHLPGKQAAKNFFVVSLVFSFGLGFALSQYVFVGGNGSKIDFRQVRQNDRDYTFINPLLSCSALDGKDIEEFKPLRNRLTSVINNEVEQGNADQVSVYFDRRDGTWLSINPDEKYFPASLMKVPVLIAVLKVAETDPSLLQKKITFLAQDDLNTIEYFHPTSTLEAGKTYTVEALLENMIEKSDNNALPLLLGVIDPKVFDEVLSDLGVTIPPGVASSLVDYLPIKTYTHFFKVLYNASYLSRPMSEKALSILSKTDFKEGIQAGVPGGTLVSHKFGERSFATTAQNNQPKELHDCGIIYLPDHPYLLCVMTKGKDFEKLSSVIEEISRVVYASMQSSVASP